MSKNESLFGDFEEIMANIREQEDTRDRDGSNIKVAHAPYKAQLAKPAPSSFVKPISKEAYLKSAAEAWFAIKHPGKDATVAIAPDGKVFVGSENTGSYWLTEGELIRKQAEVQTQILETISTILSTEVPKNVQTHKWYKALQHLVADAMTFPDIPKDK